MDRSHLRNVLGLFIKSQHATRPKNCTQKYSFKNTQPGTHSPWHWRRNNVEGIANMSTIVLRLGQWRDNLVKLKKRAGPSMGDDQHFCSRIWGSLMNEMCTKTTDRHCVLRECGVDIFLLMLPVVVRHPVVDKSLHHRQISSVFPSIQAIQTVSNYPIVQYDHSVASTLLNCRQLAVHLFSGKIHIANWSQFFDRRFKSVESMCSTYHVW